MTSLEVVKLIEAEADEEGDILEELTNQDIKEIYQQLNQQDKKRFRQFRKFHRQYFGVYGEHLPSYHMARQVVKDLMPGLPSASADVIAEKRAELLAEDRLRELCRRHGFKFPEREMRMEAPREEAAGDPTYHFPSVQDECQAGLTTTTEEEIGQLLGAELLEHEPVPAVTQVTDPRPESSISSVIKTEPGDVKPMMRTTVLSQKRLLQWQGTGDEELIITRVTKGNDPLATYYNDDEATQEAIEIEETDTEDDLSEVSMQSHGDVNKAELKAALQGLTDSHRATANHLSALSTMVTGMTEEQVDETTARVATELGAVQSFDRAQIALVLAVGVRKVEEFEILKGKRAKNDVTPFLRLAKIFGSNTRTIQECNAGIKYRYTPQERGPQREPPRRLQTTLVAETATESTTDTQRASDSSNNAEMA